MDKDSKIIIIVLYVFKILRRDMEDGENILSENLSGENKIILGGIDGRLNIVDLVD